MPIEDVVQKIVEKTGKTKEEINSEIKNKMDQLSGFVSNDGAAYIIAHQHGVKLFQTDGGKLKVKNVLAGMRSVEIAGKVLRIYNLVTFNKENRSGKVQNVIVGDETGVIRIVFWNDQADTIQNVKEGDIIEVSNGYVRDNQGRKEIHLGDRSEVKINPEGITIDNVKEDVKPQFLRKKIKELGENDYNAEILGTIVQVFNPRFYEVCPECGTRIRNRGDDKFECDTHGVIEKPDYSYVLSVFLDDGSENIRCVFFRDQAEKLLSKSKEEMLKYSDSPAAFEEVKTEMLGTIIKINGKVNKNKMFDRLEFVARGVDNKPNPEQELKNIQS